MTEGNRGGRGRFGGYCSAAQRRIRNLEKRICELEKECTHDRLTGLLKSDDFEERVLERLEKMSRKNRSDDICHAIGPVAIVFIDLDHFKNANDTLGHDAGDDLLCILASIIRDADLVVRRSGGGDEFLMALFGIDKEAAGKRLVRMRKQFEVAVSTSEKFSNLLIPVTFSFGIKEVSASDVDTTFLKTAVRDAEDEMYRHKRERATECEQQ